MEYLHTMIRVRDLEESLAFYVGLLGFEEVRRIESEDDRATCVFLAAPDDAERGRSAAFSPTLELAFPWDEAERHRGGFAHLGYRTDDIYAACARLEAEGFVLNRPPRDGFKAYFRSPEGLTVELIQRRPPLPPAEPWASRPDRGTWND